MFGTVRTIWALMVVVGHIFWVSDFGRFAVFGFYILSGYLMTYVVHENYGFSKEGRLKFLLNRFLRLYPAYWFACIFSLALLAIFATEFSTQGFHTIRNPSTWFEALTNVTMIYPHWIPHQVEPRLSPAAWALTVELFFYCLIALGISKTLTRTYIWLALSLAYIVLSYIAGLYWHARYFSIPAGSLPFALGALIYFIIKNEYCRTWPKLLSSRPLLWFSMMLLLSFASCLMIPLGLEVWIVESLFYLNTILCFLVILSLANGHPLHSKINKAWDKKLGDYSYPFYLLHYQVAILISLFMFGEVGIFKSSFTALNFIVVLSALLAFSFLIIKGIDQPVERIRRKLKSKGRLSE